MSVQLNEMKRQGTLALQGNSKLTSWLFHLEHVHHYSDHDDEYSRPHINPKPLSDWVIEFRNDVGESVGRESKDSI